MALTGLQIQKLLPKTNCKECGSNTCLAFAMKLAAKKADLSECPYASDEAKQVLGAASEPPVKLIELGPEQALKLGAETVLYRHEKTFVHQTALAININDTDSEEKIEQTLKDISSYVLERVGEFIRLDMVSITNKGSDTAAFVAIARKAWETVKRPLILRSSNPQALIEAAIAVKGSRSVIASANPQTADLLCACAKENNHVLAVTASDMDELVQFTAKLKSDGFNDLVLELPSQSLSQRFQLRSLARRTALKDNYKPLGYPFISFIEGSQIDDDLFDTTFDAVTEICKYGGICVLPSFEPAQLAPLMTLRLNIYTDPQKPIQVEPKLYAIGEPKPDSPVFVTTNFSLTYFIVSGEIENSGISAWLLVPECEGMSVLTAWAAGKFSGATIGKFAKDIQLDSLVTTRKINIPGYVAQISGELEESMPGWSVMVGPQDASDLESYIKARILK